MFNPRCVLLVGNLSEQTSNDGEKARCLDLARNDFRSVELVTYDELLLRLDLLLSVLTWSTVARITETEVQATPDEEIPF